MCLGVGQAASQPATHPTSQPATQSASRPTMPLPAKWHGKYSGVLELLNPDKPGTSQKVPTVLEIMPISGTPDVTWTQIYTVDKKEERKYVLKAVPGFPGRYLMDEQQGILIDHALIGDSLTCQFTVGGSVLTGDFELREGGMFFQIISSNLAKPRRTTVGEVKIDSYPVRTIQRGMLKKVE